MSRRGRVINSAFSGRPEVDGTARPKLPSGTGWESGTGPISIGGLRPPRSLVNSHLARPRFPCAFRQRSRALLLSSPRRGRDSQGRRPPPGCRYCTKLTRLQSPPTQAPFSCLPVEERRGGGVAEEKSGTSCAGGANGCSRLCPGTGTRGSSSSILPWVLAHGRDV